MQRKILLLSAIVLATVTVMLQLPKSLAQGRELARVLSRPAATIRPVRLAQGKRPSVEPGPLIAAGITVPAKQPTTTYRPYLAKLNDAPDPLAAINQPDIQPKHQEMARRVLSLLPVDCQSKLRSFIVRYDNPEDRGLAGRGVIILSGNVPDDEFIGLLVHEGLGHFWDLTCTNGVWGNAASIFKDGDETVYADDPSAEFYAISWIDEHTRRPSAQPGHFATRYAYESDPFEDLAEFVTLCLTNADTCRHRAANNGIFAQKLRWMEKHLPITPLSEGNEWDGTIAWDATKLVEGL